METPVRRDTVALHPTAARSTDMRERGKLATRQALLDAAMELFARHGFEDATIARIAELADVSTRTFFLHFPSKEAVLTGGDDARVELVTHILRTPEPGENAVEVFSRALHTMIDDYPPQEVQLALMRLRLSATSPAFRTSMAQRHNVAEARYAATLTEHFPQEFDRIGAGATVAAVMAAIRSAAHLTLRRNEPPEQVREAMRRAVDVVLWGRARTVPRQH
ncbi:TetR/AcrR family transcriptional regulator [Pseudonocardia sp. HH130630-07]|uniref:TetR/AcrR family transcriptional regulator n=1 Tax=Pseudonocardia sp. HH130630-07 TaxID=1690815 RepID=UPI000814F670|nr:TetR/AcrR family transcriptional regulator [Pseudonocardia sp. HH130630-07]ANY05823.1 hypothetical protein AFB00_05380 [Pseudonocardia sp. HH130630-07]